MDNAQMNIYNYKLAKKTMSFLKLNNKGNNGDDDKHQRCLQNTLLSMYSPAVLSIDNVVYM